MPKKKIVIITRNMECGGAERVIAQLSNYFVECGKECSIITLDDKEVFYKLDQRISVRSVGFKSNNKLLDKLMRYRVVRKIVKQENPDMVMALPEEIGVYVLLALLGTEIPVYVSERNNPWVMPNVKITRILRTLMYPFAKGIIFQTETAKSFFPEYIQRKAVVLHNPIETERIPCRYHGERESIIVAAGRLVPQKNFALLISAFSRFYKNHPEYTLQIYGEGELREKLVNLANSLQIAEKVELPGRSTSLLQKMNSAAMFVLTSDYEGMPNVLLEAMCMGMPVISTDCPSGGPKELIEDGINGLLVPVQDEEALLAAMNKMTDSFYADNLANKAYLMRERLTSQEVFENWYEYLF